MDLSSLVGGVIRIQISISIGKIYSAKTKMPNSEKLLA